MVGGSCAARYIDGIIRKQHNEEILKLHRRHQPGTQIGIIRGSALKPNLAA